MQVLLSELSAYRRRQRFKGRPQEAALNALLRSRTVFVHVPKCGGKSVVTQLYGVGEHDWFGHPDIAFYKALLGPHRFATFTKFTVLRAPVARCRSAFYFVRQGGFGLPKMQAYSARLQQLDFDAFVQEGLLADYIDSYLLFRPQYRFICDAAGQVQLDHLCRIERLEDDLRAAVGDLLPVGQLTRVNASSYKRDAPISAQTRAEIERLYARDMSLYHSASSWSRETA